MNITKTKAPSNKAAAGNKNKKLGLLLWVLVLFGYFLFVFNWVLMNKLNGAVGHNGWLNTFFDKNPSKTTTQAINYTITAMRGVGAVGAGFVLAKVGHKYAVIIAMGLLSIALPTIFMPYYSLFIIGRMLMAVGGTVLIVYTQPIISRYFTNEERPILSRVNSMGFNFGAAIPLILFTITPIRDAMLKDWRITASIVAGLPIILLVIYAFFGKPIDIKTCSDDKAEAVKEEPKNNASWGHIVKEKVTWKMIVFFGAWLVAVVAPILILAGPMKAIHNANIGTKYEVWEILVPIILFILGFLPGIWLVGWISKTNYDRRTYIAFMMILSILLLLGAYLCEAFVKSSIPVMIFMFLAGIILWGIQGPTLNIPHELKGNSPQRVSIIIGCTWGFGYLIYTIVNIILASILDAGTKGEQTTTWIVIGIYFAFLALMVLIAFLLPKTKDKPLISIFKDGIFPKKNVEEDKK